MTLKEYVDQVDLEQIMFIGSSVGFVFVGTKDDFNNNFFDALKRSHKGFTDENLNNMKCEIDFLKHKLEHKHMSASKRDSALLRIKSLERWVPIYEKKLQKIKENEAFNIPFIDRNVKEVYNRVLEDGVIILVDGDECGKYSFYDETPWFKKKKISKSFH